MAFVSIVLVAEGQQRSEAVTRGFMRAKLAHAQHVLEGITLKDYEMIARRAADRLAHAAEEENLEAGVLADFRLTQNCVDCHKHVRDQR